MQVAVFHPGTQHSWQTAYALQQLGRLEWYSTSIFYKPDSLPYLLDRLPGPVGRRLGREFSRFRHQGLDPGLVRTAGLVEWFERIAARAGSRSLARWLDVWGNRRFAARIAGEIGSATPYALWGYNASSLQAFEAGKAAERPLILDRTIGDYRSYNQLMAEVAKTHREWFVPTDRHFPEALIERDQHEYDLADTILCGSEYCAQSVRDWGGPQVAPKVRVLPYCYDEALFANQPIAEPLKPGEPLRFLFIGQINPRKGIHHLLEAFARIPASAASLTLVGEMRVPREAFAPHADRVTWIPTVPRAEIPAIMAAHHVLVFPSYFEGSALSLIEALASGMGVIQTQAAGNGATAQTGLMLDQPSTEGLYQAMLQAIDDRPAVDAWRAQARAEAQRYSFAAYRANIARLLAELGL
ncbi:glycosyltransferase family 4 protein [Novosphingobium sp.]|uniref:glycosyltransferase family 4 protein n=1 Tax=Novosphingobium sp. TaxID=1874826 RepID=UPI0025F59933|nr:glycosyltransferase family 4 protein [Novosphingobium sp.]MCC6927273.1 glycosyltransferase family 4 protein [Novosphingobium sp.]